MVRVGVVSPWLRDAVGKFVSIKHGVSRARNFVKWSSYAARVARGIAAGATGGVGLALGAAELGYHAYNYMKNRGRKLGVRRSAFKKNARSRGRSRGVRRGRPPTAGRAKRSAAVAFVGGGQRRVGMRYKRRRTYSRMGGMEIGSPINVVIRLGFARPMPRKTLKLGFEKRVLRWQRVNTLTGASDVPGSIPLSHATINTDQTATPCMVFCLNHTENLFGGTTGPMYRLAFSDTGNALFGAWTSTGPDGVAVSDWSVESQSLSEMAGSGETKGVRYIMPSWYDIRMCCYGATSQPTVYEIMIISFPNGYLDPLEGPSNAQEVSDRHALYQGLVQKYMSNPIMPSIRAKKQYRVHKRVTFTLQPTLNVENDTDPAMRIVKMFVRDGSLYDYRYHADGFSGAGADDKLSTTQYVGQQGYDSATEYSDVPTSRARKWLVVRALNTTRIAVGSETKANTPSFDIIVRKAEYLAAR